MVILHTVHIEDCEGWWVFGCRGSVAQHWWLKPEVSWVYGTPFVTKLKIAYGHHVSKLRREKKKKRKEELCSLALALSLTLALTLTLYHLPTSYSGGPCSTLHFCNM